VRQTPNEAFECEGIAIHRGDRARLAVRPAQSGTGLCFVRVDLEGAPRVRARLESVCDASFATSLAAEGRTEAGVSTVEHLLAALSMAGIDDALIVQKMLTIEAERMRRLQRKKLEVEAEP